MCLNIKKGTKSQIAETDIVCYKYVFFTSDLEVFRTAWCGMIVKIGETYLSNLRIGNYGLSIEEGLHSFADLQFASNIDNSFSDTLVECVIPIGSEYFTGENCGTISYASNKIKYIKVIKNFQNEKQD